MLLLLREAAARAGATHGEVVVREAQVLLARDDRVLGGDVVRLDLLVQERSQRAGVHVQHCNGGVGGGSSRCGERPGTAGASAAPTASIPALPRTWWAALQPLANAAGTCTRQKKARAAGIVVDAALTALPVRRSDRASPAIFTACAQPRAARSHCGDTACQERHGKRVGSAAVQAQQLCARIMLPGHLRGECRSCPRIAGRRISSAPHAAVDGSSHSSTTPAGGGSVDHSSTALREARHNGIPAADTVHGCTAG